MPSRTSSTSSQGPENNGANTTTSSSARLTTGNLPVRQRVEDAARNNDLDDIDDEEELKYGVRFLFYSDTIN